MNKQKTRLINIKIEYLILLVCIGLLFLIERLDKNFININNAFFISILPAINAYINIFVTLFIIIGIIAIKKRKISLHIKCMHITFILSSIFLVLFLIHIITSGKIKYGDVNKDGLLSFQEKSAIQYSEFYYYFILSTHIICASFILPFILITYYKGYIKQLPFHKKIARFTYPIWLYVTITGPIVYFMLLPFY